MNSSENPTEEITTEETTKKANRKKSPHTISKAVLKLKTTYTHRLNNNPWNRGKSSATSATVSVLEYKGITYLVTNAHAVVGAVYMCVQTNESSNEIPVETVWFDAAVDLAILKVIDSQHKKYLDNYLKPLSILNKYPLKEDKVNAHGYPIGGSNLSFTSGNVSRIDVIQNSFSHCEVVLVQTSAAVNAGNSGGPVTRKINKSIPKSREEMNSHLLDEEKLDCLGVVSSSITNANNISYFIPSATVIAVIENYFKFGRLREKKFIDGVSLPMVTFGWMNCTNSIMRSEMGLPECDDKNNIYGILVFNVLRTSAAFGKLLPNDVLMQIDDTPIQSSGKIWSEEMQELISFRYLLQKKRVYQDSLKFHVLREMKEGRESVVVDVRLNQHLGKDYLGHALWCGASYKPVTYYIVTTTDAGGYVFVVMSPFYIKKSAELQSLILYGQDRLEKDPDRRQMIVLDHIFKSKETTGFENCSVDDSAHYTNGWVEKVNNIKIIHMQALVEAIESNRGRNHCVEFSSGKIIYIKNLLESQKETAEKRLAERYSISRFYSSDVITKTEIDARRKDLTGEIRQKSASIQGFVSFGFMANTQRKAQNASLYLIAEIKQKSKHIVKFASANSEDNMRKEWLIKGIKQKNKVSISASIVDTTILDEKKCFLDKIKQPLSLTM